MCGIAGAVDLTGGRTVSDGAAAGDDRGDRPPRARRRAGPHRARRRPRCPPALDRRPGRRPAADRQRGPLDLGRLQRRALRVPRAARRSCSTRGHRLATRCDTEAWVHLYEDLGEGMFEKARGQFAVSLWDRNDRTLILGRDRVGICPLYYTEGDGWLLWGSEIKALLASGLVAARARRARDRSPLHVLLRGDDADVLRGGQVAPAGALPQGPGRPGRRKHSTGTSTSPTPGRAAARRPDAAGRRARGAADGRRSSAGCGATCRSSATSAAGSIRRSSWALQPAAGRAGAVVHDRPRRGRARRAVAGDRGRRGPRLAADDGHDGPVEDRRRPSPS